MTSDAEEHDLTVVAHGRCLCGTVRFRILERLPAVGFCHCSQCRRVSGTGSNAVLNVRTDRFVWDTGQNALRRYSTSTGWTNTFCGQCGCPMPQPTANGTRLFVPAGALDGDPPLKIAGHIFTESKPAWVAICDDSPQYPEHPSQ